MSGMTWSLLAALAVLTPACAMRNLQTEHIVTRDRGEQYTGTSREDVRSVLQLKAAELDTCYSRELKGNSSLSGKLVMKWNFNETGKVTEVSVVKSLSPVLDECVASAIKAWKFPTPGNGRFAEVSYPFLFYPKASKE